VHLDPAVPSGLLQLDGVQIVAVMDFYDGPLDGLARKDGHDYWFAAVPEWIRDSQPSEPRVMVLHEINAEQAAQVRAEHRQLGEAQPQPAAHDEFTGWLYQDPGDAGQAMTFSDRAMNMHSQLPIPPTLYTC
jgi:hypothetical protein